MAGTGAARFLSYLRRIISLNALVVTGIAWVQILSESSAQIFSRKTENFQDESSDLRLQTQTASDLLKQRVLSARLVRFSGV